MWPRSAQHGIANVTDVPACWIDDGVIDNSFRFLAAPRRLALRHPLFVSPGWLGNSPAAERGRRRIQYPALQTTRVIRDPLKSSFRAQRCAARAFPGLL